MHSESDIVHFGPVRGRRTRRNRPRVSLGRDAEKTVLFGGVSEDIEGECADRDLLRHLEVLGLPDHVLPLLLWALDIEAAAGAEVVDFAAELDPVEFGRDAVVSPGHDGLA